MTTDLFTFERRRAPRFALRRPVRCLSEPTLSFHSDRASETGLSVFVERPFEAGAELALAINVRDHSVSKPCYTWVRFLARVVNCTLADNRYRLGLQFVQFAEAGENIWLRALQHHLHTARHAG